MDNLIGPIQVQGKEVTVLFRSSSEAKVNMFRRSLLSEIETYAIDIVTFYENTSALNDETLAFLLGQIVIDNTKYTKGDNYTIHIEWIAGAQPRPITTNDLPQLPFAYVTPITILPPQARVVADAVVVRGTSKIHVKWRPISTCTFQKDPQGFLVKFHLIGMLDGPTIVQRAVQGMTQAALYQPRTIFSRPVVDNL